MMIFNVPNYLTYIELVKDLILSKKWHVPSPYEY